MLGRLSYIMQPWPGRQCWHQVFPGFCSGCLCHVSPTYEIDKILHQGGQVKPTHSFQLF
jgi:hypothetical protein